MRPVQHITLPGGFIASAGTAGMKPSGKPDLALIASANKPVATAVVTTTNQVIGEPIRWVRDILPKGCGKTRGIVINSGNANVATGKVGYRDAETMAILTAKALGCDAREILVASTGIIGHKLPMDIIRPALAPLVAKAATRNDQAVAKAILTTDLIAKTAVVRTKIGRAQITFGGIAKGSGMIAPSLATMIAVVTTDAKISPTNLKRALSEAVFGSFNAVTVDSDQSTSDIVAVFASGEAGETIKPNTAAWKKFLTALKDVCGALAYSIAADGEGATKVIRVQIRGAKTDAEAAAAAKAVADSPLLKCAIHGGDPNWGRIVMGVGKSSAKVEQDKLSCWIAGHKVFAKGRPVKFDRAAASTAIVESKDVLIEADLGLGKGKYEALGCDLSHAYVDINALYST